MKEKLDFLTATEPFHLLPAEELYKLAEVLELHSFPGESHIYQQQQSRVRGLDIIVEGAYEKFFLDREGNRVMVARLKTHDNYGASSILINKGKSINTVIAASNTSIYRIPDSIFRELCRKHDQFYQYFLSSLGREMLNETFAKYASKPVPDISSLSFDRYFVRRLDSARVRPLVTCPFGTPVFRAAQIMEENRFSCLFVENNGELAGFITDITLRNRVLGEQKGPETMVEAVMEGPVFTIERSVHIYEAILMMFQNMIRYVVVTEKGKHIGVISRNVLLSDQAQSPFIFIQSVRLARSVEELRAKWADVPEVVYNLLTRGVKSELVNEVITNISDSIAQKVIDGVIHEIGEPPAAFVFMALGSEGRKEQTLKTDQDNAIIYEDRANQFREETREYFLHFASLVSDRLNTIGFVFCTGGLMAKNPRWTHSLSHWKRNYDAWIRNPNPQSVMNFSTFFDCRLIYGDSKLIGELQAHIVKKLEDPGEYFFALLAKNALQYEPPLTFFRGIRTISKGKKQVFNIKRAMTPIVDLVRMYALKSKILKTNTGERLIAMHDSGVLTTEDFNELMQSYYYLMGMRLRYQAQQIMDDKEEPHNYVSPDSLTKIEIVTVKEIFKVIEKFQQRIRMVFTRNLL